MDPLVQLLIDRYGFSKPSAELYAKQLLTPQRDFLAGGPDPNQPAYQTMRDTALGRQLRGEAATMTAERQAQVPGQITQDAWRAFADATLNGRQGSRYEKPAMLETVTNNSRLGAIAQAAADQRFQEENAAPIPNKRR